MKDDLKNVMDSLVHMAASENDGKSTVVVRVWSDGTCDLEHYSNGEEVGEYGVRKRRTRLVENVPVERIIKGINDLYDEEWTEGRVQAPQDAREQIRRLKLELKATTDQKIDALCRIEEALKMAGNRWSEWGDRAVEVARILEGYDDEPEDDSCA